MPPLPTLFISHGAPDLLLRQTAAHRFLAGLGGQLPRPRAIVIVSAHWVATPIGVTAESDPLETIHDYYGFPAPLYERRYPARGDAALTSRIGDLLAAAGLDWREAARGLDHGAWVPLSLMYPDAGVPVAQVSLPTGEPEIDAAVGTALAPLRDEGILIIGSGGSVHNLRAMAPDGATADWAIAFEAWLEATVASGDADRLFDAAQRPPAYDLAHPTTEHFSPLVVAWRAAGAGARGVRLHASWDYTNIGMSCYLFGPSANG